MSAGFDSNPLKSSSINTRAYTDPKFHLIEQQSVFRNSWQFVCHEEKLRDNHSYVVTDAQGASILVVRDGEGELRAFYNVCKHRGHELMSGEGNVRLITCPYHAWTYNLDGQLRGARRSEHLLDFNMDEICLDQVQVETFCHLVFINLDPDAASLKEQSGELGNEIMSYAADLPQLTYAHTLTYRIKANWKAVVDNFLECYHCPVAHKDFCSLVDMSTYKVTTHGIYSSHMASAGTTGNNAYSTEDASVTVHAVWHLWPNTALMRYPGRGNFMVWRFYPNGPDHTLEQFDFYFETSELQEAEVEAIKFIDEVLQPEDIGLVESVQRGMLTPAFRQGRYLVDPENSGMSEHAVHHFHANLLNAYQSALATDGNNPTDDNNQ
ncbi:ring-hydroxylating oxygenase subunit alpha [Chromatiales bacterium (ex Bugula neritina AB1)]|nr:ring-hydroxylating oxygenase subunit alpha [Chromatiales bacterium (ex Bugula neritina AB1)]